MADLYIFKVTWVEGGCEKTKKVYGDGEYYSSMVVCAESEKEARSYHPSGLYEKANSTWCSLGRKGPIFSLDDGEWISACHNSKLDVVCWGIALPGVKKGILDVTLKNR